MKIFTKGLLLIAIPSLFELLLLATLFTTQQQALDAERWASHSKQVMRQANQIIEPLLYEALEFRTAVLVNDLSMLDSPQRHASELQAHLLTLQKMVIDNPDQRQLVDAIRADFNEYQRWLVQVKISLQEGRRDEVIERYRAASRNTLIDRIRTKFTDFIDQEERLDQMRTRNAFQVRKRQQDILLVGVLVSLFAAAAVVYLFSRGVGGRLAVLTQNAQRIASRQMLVPLVGGNDEISRLDQVLHDTSARLIESEQLQEQYKNDLERRAAELAQVNEDLRQQTQDNEMFIYSVSHDLRSPLVNLQGFGRELKYACNMLRAAVQSAHLSDEERKQFCEIIDGDISESLRFLETAVLRSSNIIDALLRLSRAGRVEYRIQETEIDPIVRRVIDALQSSIREKGAQVRILQPLPPAMADAAAIEQVFGNLLSNALKYLDPERPGEIEVGVLPAEQRDASMAVTYFVKDNGLGIPAAYMSKMFVAFQRLHASVAPGEGIGLALVRRIVERHGGRVWVESTEGQGATFFLALP